MLGNKKGLSLIELVVGTSIGAFGLIFLTQIYSVQLKSNHKSRIHLTMDILSMAVATSVMDLEFFKTEASNKNWAENNIINSCFGRPYSCHSSSYEDIKIYDRNGFQYSGTSSNPKYS